MIVMGRLLPLIICGILLWNSSCALAGLSVKKKELEKAAELAVERAAEKAAERAVEKALNSGNSSTITVTVKEAYSNSKKTAEEAAAPGSESTRPYDTKFYNRQYEAYTPGTKGQYEVYDSAEAAQLGISKEQVNSSVEELQAGAGSVEVDDPGSGEAGPNEGESGEAANEGAEDASFESARENVDKPEPGEGGGPSVDASVGLDFSGDFVGLDISAADQSAAAAGAGEFKREGTFGMKRNTRTFSDSYSKSNDYGEGKAEVDDEEDAEIMKMYASDFGDAGWSSAKQQGWTRHRPLWDDTKNRVARGGFWDDSEAANDESKQNKNKEPETVEQQSSEKSKEKTRMRKRMIEGARVPESPGSSPPTGTLYELSHREIIPGPTNNTKVAVPMKVLVSIPMPYSPRTSRGFEKKDIDTKFLQSTMTPKELNDAMRSSISTIKASTPSTTTTSTMTTSKSLPNYRQNPKLVPTIIAAQKA